MSGFADVNNISATSHQQLGHWAQQPGIAWLGTTDTIEKIYRAVDCVVLPSYREGMARSLLEAGAMGLPVVTTNVPGCRNIVTDEHNGLLCEAKSSASLQLAMQNMLRLSDDAREEMRANGRALVTRKYDERQLVEATVRAVQSALQQQ